MLATGTPRSPHPSAWRISFFCVCGKQADSHKLNVHLIATHYDLEMDLDTAAIQESKAWNANYHCALKAEVVCSAMESSIVAKIVDVQDIYREQVKSSTRRLATFVQPMIAPQ